MPTPVFPRPAVRRGLAGLALAFAAAPLTAQISQDRDPGPLLRVRCRDEAVVRAVCGALGGEPEGVARPQRDGKPWGFAEVRMTRDRAVWQGPFQSDLRGEWAEVHLQPGVALEVFADEADTLRQQIRSAAGAVLAAQGAPPQAAADWLDAALDLPAALAGSYVRIVGDPRELAPGTRLELHLVPKAETELLAWVRRLIPGPGVPAFDFGEAAVVLRTNLAADSVKATLGPAAAMLTDLAPGLDDGERAAQFETLFAFLRQFDGRSLMSMAADRWITLLGVHDPAAHAQRIASDDYLDWWRRQLEMEGKADVRITPGAVQYAGATAMRLEVDADPGANPLLPAGGTMSGFRGVAGGFDAEIGGPDLDETDFRRLVDTLTDPPETQALPQNGVLHARIDLARMLGLLGDAVPTPVRERLTQDGTARTLHVTLTKVGITLQLVFELT